jgi:hypothetical protein
MPSMQDELYVTKIRDTPFSMLHYVRLHYLTRLVTFDITVGYLN